MAVLLDKFRVAKSGEIARLAELEARGALPAPRPGPRPDFAAALTGPGVAVIAEYKRASPSKGEINLGASPEEVAEAYARAGAAAISVLTEEAYFKGSLGYLERMAASGLPLLRKDFLFDALQVKATAPTRASAFLLIVRMLASAGELADLIGLGRQYGLEAVVEIFDARDLEMAKEAGARIIQVNNRDLDTLKVSLDNSLDLAPGKSEGEIWISASGLSTPEQVAAMGRAGFDAVLIGTSLMAEGDPGAALAALTGGGA